VCYICLGVRERGFTAFEKLYQIKAEPRGVIDENRMWVQRCTVLERKVSILNSAIVSLIEDNDEREVRSEERVEYWRKMYCNLYRTHKRLLRKHLRCPKHSIFCIDESLVKCSFTLWIWCVFPIKVLTEWLFYFDGFCCVFEWYVNFKRQCWLLSGVN
jgi:hypothetical protein